MDRRVLILGGYGEAGRRLAAMLGHSLTGRITLAGRRLKEAEECAHRLAREFRRGPCYAAQAVNVSEPQQLTECLTDIDLVIVACHVPPRSLDALIASCVDRGIDYLDITPQPGKAERFEAWRSIIQASASRFVLDAGADPGLPGWLVRRAVSMVAGATDVTIWARYRSRAIGWGGSADILREAGSTGWVYQRGWYRERPWRQLCYRSFSGGLGRALCLPIRAAEMEGLPGELRLRRLRFDHAGLNPITDLLMALETVRLWRLWPFRIRQRWFYNAMRYLTRRPFGLSISLEVRGNAEQSLRQSLWHDDLYHATVAPAAIMAERLLVSEGMPADYGHLGFWAVQDAGFEGRLLREGFRVVSE
ncbi:saccharopine dehydrogenase NADP-binding domain-containing protein [Tamilnaduibacter salinus]|nr:saccharopine dehydrogenase NADP-binding domain-containing protein [Tamilnaduibacter salinus]